MCAPFIYVFLLPRICQQTARDAFVTQDVDWVTMTLSRPRESMQDEDWIRMGSAQAAAVRASAPLTLEVGWRLLPSVVISPLPDLESWNPTKVPAFVRKGPFSLTPSQILIEVFQFQFQS